MKILNENQNKILGISKKENIILESLVNSKSIFALNKDTKIPRATLYPIIKNLQERGFIKSESFGKRFKYQTVSLKILGEIIEKIGIDLKHINNTEEIKTKTINIVESKVIEPQKNKKTTGWFKSFFSN